MNDSTFDALTPEQKKQVSYATARLFLAIGLAIGGWWGPPMAYVGAVACFLYAVVRLAICAWKDSN